MKKFFLVVCLIFSVATYAQTSFKVGIEGCGSLDFLKEINTQPPIPNLPGYYIYNYSIDLMNNKTGLGFYGGGFVEISPKSPNNKFKFQIEVLYSKLAVNHNSHSISSDGIYRYDTSQSEKFGLQQISLPLKLEYYITPSFNISLGPTVNYIIGGKRNGSNAIIISNINSAFYNENIYDSIWYKIDNKIYLGLSVGATYYVYKGLFINANYAPLFGKIKSKNEWLEQNVQSVQLGVGYKF